MSLQINFDPSLPCDRQDIDDIKINEDKLPEEEEDNIESVDQKIDRLIEENNQLVEENEKLIIKNDYYKEKYINK